MQDERNRGQRQDLEKQVHGDEIRGHAHRDERPEGNEEESKELLRPLLHPHILIRVEADCRIKTCGGCGRDAPEIVEAEAHRDILRKADDGEGPAEEQRGNQQKIRRKDQHRRSRPPSSFFLQFYHKGPADHRQEKCKQKQHNILLPLPLFIRTSEALSQ